MGMLHDVKNDLDETLASFRNAARLLPGNPHIEANFIRALKRAGEFREALDRADVLVRKYPDDLEILAITAATADDALDVDRLEVILEKARRLNVELKKDGDAQLKLDDCARIRQRAQEIGLSLNDLAERASHAVRFIRRKAGFRIFGYEVWNPPRQWPLCRAYAIAASPKVAADVAASLAEEMVQSFENAGCELIAYTCTPRQKSSEHFAA